MRVIPQNPSEISGTTLTKTARLIRMIIALGPCGWLGSSVAQTLAPLSVAVFSHFEGKPSSNDIYCGAALALSENQANWKAKGYRLELKAFEDGQNTDIAKEQLKKVIPDKNLLAVLGSETSSVTAALAEALKLEHMPVVSPRSGSSDLTARNLDNINRIIAKDQEEITVALRFIHETLGTNSIYVIDDLSQASRSRAAQFRSSAPLAKLNVVGSFSGKTNLSSIAKEINQLKPDLVYYTGQDVLGVQWLKALRAANFKAIFMGTDSLDTATFLQGAGTLAPEVIYTSMVAPIAFFAKQKTFMASYNTLCGRSPSSNSIVGYDSMKVILEGFSQVLLDKKPFTRATVETGIRQIRSLQTLSGEIKFNTVGDRKKAVVYLVRIGTDLVPRMVGSQTVIAP
jgi:branched-chain amino acid transport system substrate-binding protein